MHGEGDLLPGLVVDRYSEYLVVQLLTQGMNKMESVLVEALIELLQPAGIIARNDVAVRAKEDLPQEIKILAGEIPDTVPIEMNNLRWNVDLKAGQKTGVFLDQRENYVAVSRWAHGNALDCFTGTGGFALHLASQCDSVQAVDSSASAIVAAKVNSTANSLTNIEFQQAEVLDYLPHLVNARKRFDQQWNCVLAGHLRPLLELRNRKSPSFVRGQRRLYVLHNVCMENQITANTNQPVRFN